MAVYAIYVPTATRPVRGLLMERFPSKEVAGNTLRERNALGTSWTWYLKDGKLRDRPVDTWEDHDATGYMRVWVRPSAAPVPRAAEVPDEEWLVREGGKRGVVERLPWSEGEDRVRVGGRGATVVPSVVVPRAAPVAPPVPRTAPSGGPWVVPVREEPARMVPRRPYRSVPLVRPRPPVRPPLKPVAAPVVCERCFEVPTATGVCGCAESMPDVAQARTRAEVAGGVRCESCGDTILNDYGRCRCS